jgi:hypothetical protein
MNKTKVSRIATVSVFVLMGAGLVLKTRSSNDASSTGDPLGVVYAALDAARGGNVQMYLAHFTGPIEATLQQTVAESTESGFGAYLKESNAGLKGVAVGEPQPVDDGNMKARVEFVYVNRTVAQTMYLARAATGWKISRIDGEEQVRTPFPYGTRIR